MSKAVLIDDDNLVQMVWKSKAKDTGVELSIYPTPPNLDDFAKAHPLSTPIYIDSDLGEERGEDLALKLKKLGYTSLYITSGYESEKFSHLDFLKGIIGKNPPF